MAAEAHLDNLDDDDRDDDTPDDVLTDDALQSEIELVSVLVVAATSSNRRLRQDEVDRLLGVNLNMDDPQHAL